MQPQISCAIKGDKNQNSRRTQATHVGYRCCHFVAVRMHACVCVPFIRQRVYKRLHRAGPVVPHVSTKIVHKKKERKITEQKKENATLSTTQV
jgi:hypothetical protein